MKKSKYSIKDWFKIIIGFILIIFLAYISWKLIGYFLTAAKTFFESYTTIAVALVTGLLAFLSAVIAKVVEHKFSIDNQIRGERQEKYVEFLDWVINSLLYGEMSEHEKLVDEIKKYQKNMTIYGSDKVLKAWIDFKKITMNTVLGNKEINHDERMSIYAHNEAIYLEKLLLSIRKDLGYKNKHIKQFDILRLYINDFDIYLSDKANEKTQDTDKAKKTQDN